MRIVVCLKAVPSTTEVKMDPETHTIVRDGRQAVVNPFDASALEVALGLRERLAADGEPCTVEVLSMGIPATERLLRDAIARGADAAVLLSDRAFAGADTLATTYALTCGMGCGAVASAGSSPVPDLVLCGKMAVDGDTAQIGPELAGALGAACLTDVREVTEIDAERVQAWHGTDAGPELAEAKLPAVLTVAKEAAQLRMPSIAGVRAAELADVAVRSAADAGADPARTGLAGSPTQVVRSFVPERAAEGVEVTGAPREQAARLVELIGGMGL